MDIQHYYIEKGQGESLILLHGNGENCGYFQGQIDEFSKLYHVYAIDTRGHGRTPRGNKPFTIRQFSEDLLCFMDDYQIEKMILNGANLNAAGVKRTTQIPIEIGYRIAGRFAGKSDSARLHAEMLGLMVNDPNVDPGELSRIQAKTLVIAGTNDMIRKEHTKLIADRIPVSELVFIKGDHFIAAKHPDEFNQVVLQFLQDRKDGCGA